MAKSPTITGLEELFKPLDNTWINKNSLVINYARNCGLAVGGSIAMAISNKKPHKIPNDFDFFTDKNDKALDFLNKITSWLSRRPNTNYKVLFNNKNKFTLPGVSNHIRIMVPFWKPICIMTLESPIRTFYFKGGLEVQYFDDVVSAAKHVSCIDNKERLPFNVEECRENIRTRHMANGTYDVDYEPEVPVRVASGRIIQPNVTSIILDRSVPCDPCDHVEMGAIATQPTNRLRRRTTRLDRSYNDTPSDDVPDDINDSIVQPAVDLIADLPTGAGNLSPFWSPIRRSIVNGTLGPPCVSTEEWDDIYTTSAVASNFNNNISGTPSMYTQWIANQPAEQESCVS